MKKLKDNYNKGFDDLKNLDDIRKVIDDCDRDLVRIFEKRLLAVSHVLEYKRQNNLPILQSGREEEVLKKVKSYLDNPEFDGELESLYSQILKISRKFQSKKLFPFNIVLIGFMGSGKTTVGQQLSRSLEMEYIDTDNLIVEKLGITINEIFETHGEAYFRKLEMETVKSLETYRNTVISCGGGVVLDPENIKNLKQHGNLIWLQARPEEIYNRISHDKTRPLLKENFTVDYLKETLEPRLALYSNSHDIKIETDGKSIEEICNEIIEKLIK